MSVYTAAGDGAEFVGSGSGQLKKKKAGHYSGHFFTQLRTIKTEIRIPKTPNLACHQCWGQAESNYSCVVPRIFTDRKAQIPQ
jgi:hypothetical protein